MKILSINAGSSSLKFTLIEMPEEKVVVSGTFEKIGGEGSFYTIKYNGEKIVKDAILDNHRSAVRLLLDDLIGLNIISSYDEIKGVGHRVVHGGDVYSDSVVIDANVLQTIEDLVPLAPLHNPANLVGIKSFTDILPTVTQVAVFDTAFHQTMDKEEFIYPVPFEWFTKYGVRKYGFHGTSHKYVSEFVENNIKKGLKVINCHIGNGASICAIKDGKSIDTSMGFTPTVGVMMGTRCGDVDMGIIPYIMDKTGDSLDGVISDLNKRSGMTAISDAGSDLRDIEEGYENGNDRCVLAINMYVKKIVNYVSMYNTLLEGADVITFTAGVGENSYLIRKLVCERLACLGVKIDNELNDGLKGKFTKLSTDDSKIEVYLVPTDEELMIAKDTYEFIK
ncbi:MAG: acetate kinase [Bacilli bacterium]|nr:acetate kinase [Bacilli bacterium]